MLSFTKMYYFHFRNNVTKFCFSLKFNLQQNFARPNSIWITITDTDLYSLQGEGVGLTSRETLERKNLLDFASSYVCHCDEITTTLGFIAVWNHLKSENAGRVAAVVVDTSERSGGELTGLGVRPSQPPSSLVVEWRDGESVFRGKGVEGGWGST